jgi:hypothetical protein
MAMEEAAMKSSTFVAISREGRGRHPLDQPRFVDARAGRLSLFLFSLGALLGGCSRTDAEPADEGTGGADPGASSSTGPASSATSSSGASGGEGSASECAPGPTDAFLPLWVPPTPLHQAACNAVEVGDFVARCLTEDGDCASFMTDAPECHSCALSFIPSTEYGPVFGYDELGVFWANRGGCVAATTGDVSETSCGAKLLALDQCEMAACQACAQAGDADEYMACLDAAEQTSCQDYATESEECLQAVLVKGGRVVDCDWPREETFESYATRLVRLFCSDPKESPCPACTDP